MKKKRNTLNSLIANKEKEEEKKIERNKLKKKNIKLIHNKRMNL